MLVLARFGAEELGLRGTGKETVAWTWAFWCFGPHQSSTSLTRKTRRRRRLQGVKGSNDGPPLTRE